MAANDKYLKRAIDNFEAAKKLLAASTCEGDNTDLVAACLVVAAQLENVEDAIVNGLPTAGEGI